MTRTRMGLVPGLLLALALAVAACGGGKGGGVASRGDGKATATTAAGGSSRMQGALAFARCMRQHGINLPDPKVTAEGILQELPRGVGRDDPRLSAAEHACHQYGSLPPSNGPQRGGGGK